jgi:hypothetical protein
MAGVANRAARVLDWKFTTSCREAGSGMMPKKTSSRSVGNATDKSIQKEL